MCRLLLFDMSRLTSGAARAALSGELVDPAEVSPQEEVCGAARAVLGHAEAR